MRVPRSVIRRLGRIVNNYSLNVLETAAESLTESLHDVVTDTQIKEYKAVDVV